MSAAVLAAVTGPERGGTTTPGGVTVLHGMLHNQRRETRDPVAHPFLAAATALSGAVAAILADTAGSDIPNYVGVGAQLTAVGGLVYVVRALLSGDLVARNSAEVRETLAKLVESAHARERILETMLRDRDHEHTHPHE